MEKEINKQGVTKEDVNNNFKEMKKTRRIGTFTFGLILILCGICVLIVTFSNIDMIRYIFMLSPIIFISLGIEVIVNYKNSNLKYDFLRNCINFYDTWCWMDFFWN